MRLIATVAGLALVLSAGAASAFDLEQLELGTPKGDVQLKLTTAGANIAPVGSDSSVLLVTSPQPGQLTFCNGTLSLISVQVPGGIQGYLQRAQHETQRRGLARPDVTLMPKGDEFLFGQWEVGGGASLVLAWTADAEGSFGSVIRYRPCPTAEAAAVAAASHGKSAQDGVLPAAAPPSDTLTSVVVPLPETPTSLAVEREAKKPEPRAVVRAEAPASEAPRGATAARPAPDGPRRPVAEASRRSGGEEAAPGAAAVIVPIPEAPAGLVVNAEAAPARRVAARPPQPRARPRTLDAAAAAPAVVQKRGRTRNETSGIVTGTPAPLLLPVPEEPDTTNSTEPAASPEQDGDPAEAQADPPARQPAAATDLQPLGRPTPAKARPGVPSTASDCARLFRSYDASTGTYRTLSGAVRSCP